MNQYRLFVISFIISVLAFVAFLMLYISVMMNIIEMSQHGRVEDPSEVFRIIFSPALLLSALLMGLGGLCYRVLGIIFIARNTRLEGGEKAIWIIGFVLFGFITAIVFMAMARSRNLVSKPAPDMIKYE